MSRLDIEDWEKNTAEVEMRRWLAKMGLWEPGVDMEKWRTTEADEVADQEQPVDGEAAMSTAADPTNGAAQEHLQRKPVTPAAKGDTSA